MIVFVADLCFTADVFYSFQHETSEMHRLIGVKFCTVISSMSYFIMPVQNFGGPSPQKIIGPKTCIIWHNIEWLQTSMVNIFVTDKDRQNQTSAW